MSRILTFRVQGMTCVSCERTVQKTFQAQPGVQDATVSLKKAEVVVRLRDDAKNPNLDTVNAALKPYGYRAFTGTCEVPNAAPLRGRLTRAIWSLVLVGIVLALLSPLRVLVPSIDATASVGALFLFGIVASVSSCLATTGGFLLAYSAKVASKQKTIAMHIGRLAAFAVGGALLGALGGVIPQSSPILYGAIGLFLGIGFLSVALSLLDLSPSMARWGIRMPSALANVADRVQSREGKVTPFLVGAATFILPCGFTQTAQALALASGSWIRGAMLLEAFAIGTLPVLYGITMMASKATMQSKTLRAAAGAVMFFFAIGQINGGLTMLGSPYTFDSLLSRQEAVASAPVQDAAEQVITMDVTSYGYQPDSFTIKKGVPVRWEINGIDVGGCTNSIVSRQLGISQPLQKGLNVITFTAQQTGRIAFSCGMGMVRGSFNVI